MGTEWVWDSFGRILVEKLKENLCCWPAPAHRQGFSLRGSARKMLSSHHWEDAAESKWTVQIVRSMVL